MIFFNFAVSLKNTKKSLLKRVGIGMVGETLI